MDLHVVDHRESENRRFRTPSNDIVTDTGGVAGYALCVKGLDMSYAIVINATTGEAKGAPYGGAPKRTIERLTAELFG